MLYHPISKLVHKLQKRETSSWNFYQHRYGRSNEARLAGQADRAVEQDLAKDKKEHEPEECQPYDPIAVIPNVAWSMR